MQLSSYQGQWLVDSNTAFAGSILRDLSSTLSINCRVSRQAVKRTHRTMD